MPSAPNHSQLSAFYVEWQVLLAAYPHGLSQRLACLSATGAMRTTPTAALEIIAGVTPLPVFYKTVSNACLLSSYNSWSVDADQLRPHAF